MPIPTLRFGRTGHVSTRAIFGGAALAHVTQAEADAALDILLRYGVNHIDVAASYGDAEVRVAPWLKRNPGHFFVATKTDGRTKQDALDDLHRSLDRLGVDALDLWQLHALADPIEWDTALSPGGAIEAAQEARAQGLVKAVGVTGHGMQIAATHRRSLQRYDFDSVLAPYNYLTMQTPYYRENFDALQSACQERDVAVQTIKAIARRPLMGRRQRYTTWYEPLEEQDDIDQAVWWTLSRPGIFLNTVGDLTLAPRVLDAASRFDPTAAAPTDERMRTLMARVDADPLFV